MPSNEPICGLCNDVITDKAENLWCYGCKHYVCEKHQDEAWGSHSVFEHDHSYWDGDDE